MKYLDYPGCCCLNKASGKAYGESLMAIFNHLGVEHEELEDWNCCGATMYMSIDEHQSFALVARNLALAEQQDQTNGQRAQLVPPCAACYAVMNKANNYMQEYEEVGRSMREALAAADLHYTGAVDVRHPLDVLVNDIGVNTIADHVQRPLNGMRIASYYGCLLVRPYATFDDQYNPTTMDRLLEAMGAEPVDWPLKTRCCGGSLSGTIEDVGVRLGYLLLAEAHRCGADAIATACPFCQFNLEFFQQKMIRDHHLEGQIPVGFFTQYVGIALGLPDRDIGLQRLVIPLPVPANQGEQEPNVTA